MSRVFAELALGMRLAFTGGRRGWTRTLMAATGVAVGMAALLLGAAVPTMMEARDARVESFHDAPPDADGMPKGRTLAIASVESEWDGHPVRGRLIWPESSDAPLPPGVPAFPGEHEMYASPALIEALDGLDGEVLRRQMPYRIAGTIAPAGLAGPRELAYYGGYQRVEAQVGKLSWRVDRFGRAPRFDPPTGTYVVVSFLLAAFLVPVGIFIGAALRFGADTRDRRLAAIRLAGADNRAVLRIALGDTLAAVGPGLVLGALAFVLARSQVARFELSGISVFPHDVRPVPALALLAVSIVLILAAGVTLLGYRGVSVEPLGVFRRSKVWRGRLWWRLVLPAACLALLYPLFAGGGDLTTTRISAGAIVLLVALLPLLPYVVPLVARLLPNGPVSWQLASQQLRGNPAASTRAVAGMIVAVAGAIALHSFFAASEARREAPLDPSVAAFTVQAQGRTTPAAMRERSVRFEKVDGARAGTVAQYLLYPGDDYLMVGDCADLRAFARLDRCEDGDAFVTGAPRRAVSLAVLRPGAEDTRGATVAVPSDVRRAALTGSTVIRNPPENDLLLTPAAAPAVLSAIDPLFVETRIFLAPDRSRSVAREIRGVAAEVDPLAGFTATRSEPDSWATVRTGVDIASTLLMIMLGAGLLLDVADRLRERRRLLGVLAAVGGRRSTLAWSVLLLAFVPVLAGLVLAALAGTVLGAVLMRAAALTVRFDVAAVAGPVAVGAALVLVLTTAVLLPALRRVTRTEELRYE